ncbi:hypothetical protein B0H13DRAFT_2278428 [Mycena leptocephala]|nr:hypothetical protein B0H13DRAFT_2278428 [Mycena leptocephala]
MLGLTPDQYRVFQELELSPQRLYTFLECTKCKGSVLVERMDIELTPILECKIPGCGHMWCKTCQGNISDWAAAVEHICPNVSALQDVVQLESLIRCPGCQTPYEKMEGTDHVQCPAPGCMTHFCYACGESIVRSTVPEDINETVTAHEARCGMLEYAPA